MAEFTGKRNLQQERLRVAAAPGNIGGRAGFRRERRQSIWDFAAVLTYIMKPGKVCPAYQLLSLATFFGISLKTLLDIHFLRIFVGLRIKSRSKT